MKQYPISGMIKSNAMRRRFFAEYEKARGVLIGPPIPIEDIVEKHLRLCIEFDNTHELFGIPRRFCRQCRYSRCLVL